METPLIAQAVSQRGADLVFSLQQEQQDRIQPLLLQQLSRHITNTQPEIQDPAFNRSVNKFIAKKADMVFKALSSEKKADLPLNADDNYAIMPALESFMGMPPEICKEHFFNSIERFEIVIGVVTSVMESGLLVSVLCLDSDTARDIDNLKILAFCPVKELPKIVPDQPAIESFHANDIVRGTVVNLSQETQRMIISLVDRTPLTDKPNRPKLGLITEDDFPVHYRRKLQVRGLAFDELQQSIVGFNNTGNVDYLVQMHNLSEDSLMRGLNNVKLPEKEYAENLRKWQCQKLALQSVAQGVSLFKKGKQMEAMQHLNKALQIDDTNVEALVARGALYANNESFARAVEDFEAALKINSSHANATKYLLETRLAQGKQAEDQRDYLLARECYRQAVTVDPTSREAIASLQELEQKLARSGQSERKRSPVGSPGQSSPRRYRDNSPRRRDSSPRRRDSSPRRRDSPKRRGSSPMRKDSPKKSRDGSQKREKSKKPVDISPSRGDSPKGKESKDGKQGTPKMKGDGVPKKQGDSSHKKKDSKKRSKDKTPKDKSSKRGRNNSPSWYSDGSPPRAESPSFYRKRFGDDHPLDKLQSLMEPKDRKDNRQTPKKRTASTTSDQQQPKKKRGSDDRLQANPEGPSSMNPEREEDPYANLFSRPDAIPCFGSPDRIGTEVGFPGGFCNPQGPQIPGLGGDTSGREGGREILFPVISPHDSRFREELVQRQMYHGDSSPNEFDKSHSPQTAKSKSPFDEEAFLYGESEYDTLDKKPAGWDDHGRERRDSMSPEWEQRSRVVRVESPRRKKESKKSSDKRNSRERRDSPTRGRYSRKDRDSPSRRSRRSRSGSYSSSDSYSSSSSSGSSSSSSSSTMGDDYEQRSKKVPKGIRPNDTYFGIDFDDDKDSRRSSLKGRNERMQDDNRRYDAKRSREDAYEEKGKKDKSMKGLKQTKLYRDDESSSRSPESYGSREREEKSLKSDGSGWTRKEFGSDKSRRERKDKNAEKDSRFRKFTKGTPEKVIQDARVSSYSEKYDGRDKRSESRPENPALSPSLFHITSKWDSPPHIEMNKKPDPRKYENIQISISTAPNNPPKQEDLNIFSGKQLSKYRASKHQKQVKQEEDEEDELERLFQKEKKAPTKPKPAIKIEPLRDMYDPFEKALEAKEMIEKLHGKALDNPNPPETFQAGSFDPQKKSFKRRLGPRTTVSTADDLKSDRPRDRSNSRDRRRSDSRDRRNVEYRSSSDDEDYRKRRSRSKERKSFSAPYKGAQIVKKPVFKKGVQKFKKGNMTFFKKNGTQAFWCEDMGHDFDYARWDARPRKDKYPRQCDEHCRQAHDNRLTESQLAPAKRPYDSSSDSEPEDRKSRRSPRPSPRRNSKKEDEVDKKTPKASKSSDGPKCETKEDSKEDNKVDDPDEFKEDPDASLNDLESFLHTLKDKKKQQWIAEGKVKNN